MSEETVPDWVIDYLIAQTQLMEAKTEGEGPVEMYTKAGYRDALKDLMNHLHFQKVPEDASSELLYNAPPVHETRKVIVMSTGHIAPSTLDRINASPLEGWPIYGGKLPSGFYMHVPENKPEKGWPSISSGLTHSFPSSVWDCLLYAKNYGFDYVQFDGDGPHIPNLSSWGYP